jgi:hypothetical protein
MAAQYVVKQSVNKVFPSITDDDTWHSKSWENDIIEKVFHGMFHIFFGIYHMQKWMLWHPLKIMGQKKLD